MGKQIKEVKELESSDSHFDLNLKVLESSDFQSELERTKLFSLLLYKSFQLVFISFFGCNREAKLCKKKQDRLIMNSNK